MRQKKILVTGGAGFIGSHLCEKLLKEGNNVVCMDNFYTGSKNNIAHLLKNPKFTLEIHDVTESYEIEADEIYNLACPASPVHYQHNPVKTVKTAVLGAINALEAAKQLHCKVLQASTSEVYGNPYVHPQTENYWGNVNPIGIRSCYDEGKRCAETLFMDYHRQDGVEIKIVRIFNTYGPRMSPNDGRVIPNFIMQALTGEDITIYGNGTQTRCFQYIDDLIDGLLKLMNSEKDITGPVNIGNTTCYNMINLAKKIIELTHSGSKIRFLPLPSDDPLRRKPNINRAKELLQWEPKVSLEKGLIPTIEYFKKHSTVNSYKSYVYNTL